MARRNIPHVDRNTPLEFGVALSAWRKVVQEQGAPTLRMDPTTYDTVGKARRRVNWRACLTCGSAGFIRFTWPMGHPYFGRSVKCPACND